DQLGGRVSLRALGKGDGVAAQAGGASNPLVEWLNDLPAIRDELTRLQAMPAGSGVMVPVIIEK
ncbi:MAG TPA: hypothetical protein VG711_07075, partial [Phycisphaerales bacterium]|nr:hypothetical protein [Phycisphaerales bacterium]